VKQKVTESVKKEEIEEKLNISDIISNNMIDGKLDAVGTLIQILNDELKIR
jgi:hypothetical protein